MKNDGGQAFPNTVSGMVVMAGGAESKFNSTQYGMSLRDYMAGQALAGGLIAHLHDPDCQTPLMDFVDVVAHTAYMLADAMIEEREK